MKLVCFPKQNFTSYLGLQWLGSQEIRRVTEGMLDVMEVEVTGKPCGRSGGGACGGHNHCGKPTDGANVQMKC